MLRPFTIAVLLAVAATPVGQASDAGAFAVAPRACGGDAWSYAIARDRSAPDGRYAVGPQTYCAEVAREEGYPVGPIGIVVDPFSDRAPPARPVPPLSPFAR
ncbi:hypothetical protein [Salinarimonas sp.]|uniref:hypothetical protein n=1 Tax=Salinarimonas sp. TaxID=2766526 RepID=UPI0032D94205